MNVVADFDFQSNVWAVKTNKGGYLGVELRTKKTGKKIFAFKGSHLVSTLEIKSATTYIKQHIHFLFDQIGVRPILSVFLIVHYSSACMDNLKCFFTYETLLR